MSTLPSLILLIRSRARLNCSSAEKAVTPAIIVWGIKLNAPAKHQLVEEGGLPVLSGHMTDGVSSPIPQYRVCASSEHHACGCCGPLYSRPMQRRLPLGILYGHNGAESILQDINTGTLAAQIPSG